MALQTLQDLFMHHREKATGHWRVGDGSFRTVYLDTGDIVFASSTFPNDRLTSVMVEQGKLTQGQMDHALTNLKPGMSVGKNLIEMGFITQRDLLDMARLQVEKIVWSAMLSGEPPSFESKEELEETIVRLPLDTPTLLFKGIIKMPDRESLLEMLGPLNQVVLLQGKRVYDIDLPDDLRKLASMMDGSHTILELSNESGVEPMKIGAFAVFLREMGWGKLFELPPINRKVITEVLDPAPTMPPPSVRNDRPSLFNVIEDAGKQTTKLEPEPVSDPLDGAAGEMVAQEIEPEPLGLPEKPQEPEGSGEPEELRIPLEQLDTPEAPAPPIGKVLPYDIPEEAPPAAEEPPITISREDPFDGDEKENSDPPKAKNKTKKKGIAEQIMVHKKKSRALPRLLVFLTVMFALAYAAYHYYIRPLKNRAADPPFTLAPTPEEDLPGGRQEPAANAGQPSQVVREEELPAQAPASIPASVPAPLLASELEARPSQVAALVQSDITKEARFGALANGNIARALDQGAAFQATVPKHNWTIRLIVACQWDNLQYCAQTLGPSFELFLRPYRFRDGRQCYQLFVGRFPNSDAAEAEQKKIMLQLLVERKVEPKIMQISDISENQ
ncbi:MAG: hypothetical protein LBC63_04295 [Holophagales bacterium]|jgi:hypothetical protein|nr:hypothetical protein [Holophagales bacterium]